MKTFLTQKFIYIFKLNDIQDRDGLLNPGDFFIRSKKRYMFPTLTS